MSEQAPTRGTTPASAPDLGALAAITDAVEAGAGLPEVLRAAARALDASLILIDRSATILAVAARSPADERSLMRDTEDVTTIELKVPDVTVGVIANPMSGRDIRRLVASASVFPNAEKPAWWSG